jgi:hypothetical protein
MRYETAKRYVLRFYPDAICKMHPLTYSNVVTVWHVIHCDFSKNDPRKIYGMEIGASSKNEKLAWIKAANHLKNDIIPNMTLNWLES